MQISKRSIASFDIVKTLREGPLGGLYQVSDRGSLRCLRVLPASLVDSPERRERFQSALDTDAKVHSLQHVPLLAAGISEPDGRPWLLTEWLSGEDVGSRARREGKIPQQLFQKIFTELAQYLDALKESGLSHGYLKPENLQLVAATESGSILRVVDLGIGQMLSFSDTRTLLNPVHMLGWQAPEQTTTGYQASTASDIWTLGLIAFYLLTGRCYFPAAERTPLSVYELLRDVAIAELPDPCQRAIACGQAEHLPSGFNEWFRHCVVREPKARFDSATEAVGQLLALFAAAPQASASTGTLAIGRHGIVELPEGFCFAGRFRILRPIGEGGMGVIYEVEQMTTRARRALKLMKPELLLDESLRQRFVKEARVVSQVKSDHVVQVLDAGIDEPTGMPWLLMTLLDGEELTTVVNRSQGLRHRDALDVITQIGDALSAAHQVGIVHRDLKPENVFVSKSRAVGVERWVELLDFGIAKVLSDSLTVAVSSRVGNLGTPLWMAPEQTDGRSPVTAAADIWSLGLLTFFLLTGRSYWKAAQSSREPTLGKLLREVLSEHMDPASHRASEYGLSNRIPDGFDAWFSHCVAHRPEDRFASVSEAVNGLREILIAKNDVAQSYRASFPLAIRQSPAHHVVHKVSLGEDALQDRGMNRWWLVTMGALALCLVMLLVVLLSPVRIQD